MLGSLGSGHRKVVTEPPILPKEDSVSRPKRGKSRALTERQRRVLEVIRRHCKEGLPPTRAQIAEELGLTNISAIDGHLFRLSARGFLQLFPGVERGIRLLREGAPLYEDPAELLAEAAEGRIVDPEGGKRLHDFDSFTDIFDSPPDLFLRVESEAMAVGRYCPGDVVAVCRDLEPGSEEVVVGKVGQDIALRHASRLQDKDFDLIGVVVGAIIKARRATHDADSRS